MKRIVALLVCGLLLAVSSSAEARWSRRNNGGTYNQPMQYAPAATTAQRTTAYKPVTAETASADTTIKDTSVVTASAEATSASVTTVDYSTRTAQGVANIMASRNQVGHWGGNPGYEGCGCGATPQAAYSICCYANSGMATVDVGYAKSASGMWYCCRRYR
jgi:hypothetical protein